MAMEGSVNLGEQTHALTALAHGRAEGDRERLLMAVVELCEGVQAINPEEVAAVQTPLADLFMSLVVEAEREVRIRLADRIAAAAWAPPALVNVLALDEIEIARPVIAASPLLKDEDLIRLLVQATLDHQVEVALRANISPLVVDAILEGGDPIVLTALASNATAEIGPVALGRLVEESRRAPGLRSPLARHPRLTPDLAERLYAWVGDSLKAAIAHRFQIDAAALDRAVAETLRDIHAAHAAPAMAAAEDREAMEHRLVDKLHDAGQLRTGYLLRALREHKLSLFEAALSKLSGLPPEVVRICVDGDRPEQLALACLSAGIDRSVYPTVLDLVRQLNGGRPAGAAETERRSAEIYGAYTPQTAPAVLREILGR